MNELHFTFYACVFFCVTIKVTNQDVASSQSIDDATILTIRRGRLRKLMNEMTKRNPMRNILQSRKEICYDMVGCFNLPRKASLKKPPQSPQHLDTKFWLYTRDINESMPLNYPELLTLRHDAELLKYGDDLKSINKSNFSPSRSTIILIHGYKGSGKDKGALSGVREFLKLADVNVLVVDWEKGAGDSYQTAVANTELVGRQTAVVIMDMILLGADVKDMHVVGFSLGAHIAGCTGEMLKSNGFKLGRITGLDPASPLFKNERLRESSRKLDSTDADFVDIIHTDGSPVFTDGFGLLRPIGHVDYFPNGGREQPGCTDTPRSVVVSRIEGTLNESLACSHVRAWRLFLETVVREQDENTECKLIAYQCPNGANSFLQGKCQHKPESCAVGDTTCNIMGMGTRKNGARGVLYLATRDSPPYCGDEIRINVAVSERTSKIRGVILVKVEYKNETILFKVNTNLPWSSVNGEYGAVGAIKKGSLDPDQHVTLQAVLELQSVEQQQNTAQFVAIDKITLTQGKNSWHSCKKDILLSNFSSGVTLPLNYNTCQL